MTNYSNRIALTIDIEDWYHTPAITGSDFSFFKDVPTFMNEWKERYDYLTNPTKKILDLLDKLNQKATFFIVADTIDNYPRLIDNIVDQGHEIACHGLHHSTNIDTKTKKPMFSKMEFEDSTGRAREKLISYTGQSIIGYRAPGAYIGKWMFRSLIKLGFKYDSSINPNSFFKKTDFDTSKISSRPYYIKVKGKKTRLIELPWPFFKYRKLKFPTAGGPFLRFLPAQYIVKGLNSSLKRGNTVFYLHSIDISDEKLPSIASNNSRRPFYFATKGSNTFTKLEKILYHFDKKWTTCSSIYKSINSIRSI